MKQDEQWAASLRARAEALEHQSERLEPNANERRRWLDAVGRYGERWLESLPSLPGQVPEHDAAIAALDLRPIEEAPASMDEILEALRLGVDAVGVNESSARFFGYIPGSGTYMGALGDYLAAVTNRYAGVKPAGPGAVRLERKVLGWIASWLGYPENCGGDLTSGGSVATLGAMVTARDAKGVEPENIRKTVIYLSVQTHHAVDKALRIAGFKRAVFRLIPVDERFRMRADALDATVRADREAGLKPWIVIASAGSTDTSAIDPLPAIADICAEHGLWFHVDAAYGGAFALCESGRRKLAGIERSDSVVFDPHKGLFVPWGTGVVLVKDRDAMAKAHAYQASYLADFEEALGVHDPSPADLSAELSRPFRGLRVWMTLQLAGVAAIRAALEEKLILAEYFHGRMALLEDFEVGPPPDLSVVIFRWVPSGHDPDAANRALVSALQDDGRIYLSSTVIDGKATLRLAILNARTHLTHIDTAIEAIVDVSRGLLHDGLVSA